MFDYRNYLANLDLDYLVDERRPTLANLAKLQLAHLSTFPFQSLSTVLHLPISLDLDAIYQKIVIQKQGGYCYEHTLLVLAVLKALGYTARPLTGYIVHDNDPDLPKARTHALLLVVVEGQDYLLDVGYGGLVPTAPLKFVVDSVQDTPHGRYKISRYQDKFILCAEVKDNYQMLYAFDLTEQNSMDLEMGNWFISTFPKSPFRKMLMASRIEPNGIRHNLLNSTYKRHEIGKPTVTEHLADRQTVLAKLKEVFWLNTDKLVSQGDEGLLQEVLANE